MRHLIQAAMLANAGITPSVAEDDGDGHAVHAARQLGMDTHALLGAAHAAVQHVFHAELTADRLGTFLGIVLERRVAADDVEIAEA